MAYEFRKTRDKDNNFDVTSVTVLLEHNEHTLDEMLDAFSDFLKACGWSVDGTIEVVPPDEPEEETSR
jgi:hypothetical protein